MPSLEFKRIELSDKEIVNNFLNNNFQKENIDDKIDENYIISSFTFSI